MSDTSQRAAEEYHALRATIRERGTLRLFVTVITFVAWSALLVAVQALFTIPVLTLVPLVTLAVGFEVIFATHVGVERIGRYLYVHHESANHAPPQWEHAVALLGPRANAGSGLDPLFSLAFIGAALVNLIPLALMTADSESSSAGGVSWPFLVLGLAHALFVVRILGARRFASRQRALDTELFQAASRRS